MRYINNDQEIQQNIPSVVTVGKFDGFHRGHQKLLQRAAELRGEECQVVLFTFSRSPQMVLANKMGAGLNTHDEKMELARRFGVDLFVEYPFSDAVRHMSAEVFLEDILMRQLNVRHIVAGPDCHFGFQRRGDIDFLQRHSEAGGFSVHVVDKERYGKAPISSTRIRSVLQEGKVEEAAAMLGYPFGYRSKVIHGKQLGRKLGFPTINQMISPYKIVPAFGVYAAEVELEGKTYQGIANVGVKPTVSGCAAVGVETSIFDFDGDVYGKTVRVNLRHFVRPEKKFDSLDALRHQVEKDKRTVRSYWDQV